MNQHIGNATITPSEAEAGQTIILEISLVIGAAGLPSGGLLLVDCPGYLGASRPQFYYSEQEGYVVVRHSRLDLPWRGGVANFGRRRWLWNGNDYQGLGAKQFREFRLLGLVYPEGIPAKTEVTIQLGASGGGFTPGYKVGTVAPRPGFAHRFLLSVYPSLEAREPLETRALEQTVRPQPAACARLIHRATGTSCLVANDIFGNPAPLPADLQTPSRYQINSHGVAEFGAAPAAVRTALPVSGSAPMAGVVDGYNLYWGDLHLHSLVSGDVKSSERNEMTPLDCYRFGQEAAGLDFMALTDHHYVGPGKEQQKLTAAEWQQIAAAVAAFDGDSAFVAIPGMEHQNDRGDHVMLFGETPTYEEVTAPETANLRVFWQRLRHRDVLTIPHFHNPGDLPEGEWYRPDDPALDPVMEVFSCHGRFDGPRWDGMPLAPPRVKVLRADRNGRWFLRQGYRYGVLCSSDDHKCRPGSNGLAAVFARDLSRKSIFEALRARRCYGTTNARIRLVFTLNGHLMGSVLAGARQGAFRVAVAGTAPVECVDILRNGDLHKRFTPGTAEREETWTEPLAGGGECFQVRVLQADQEMAFSSPIWVD